MSTQKLAAKVARHTVTTDSRDASLTLRQNGPAWDVSVFMASPDEYQVQESGRFEVMHHDGRCFRQASIHVFGRPGEPLDAVLLAALDFVRTETPVPL